MRSKALTCLGFLLIASLAACGGGDSGPLVPTDAARSAPAPTMVSGLDGTPVSALVTGSGGELTLSAPGFLTLDTVERPGPRRLWPNDGRVTLADTYEFVYGSNDLNPLRRLGDSTTAVAVMPGPVVAGDRRAMAALQAGAQWVNDLMAEARIDLHYVVGGPGQVQTDVDVDPNDPGFQGESKPGALAYCFLQGNVTVGARIAILDIDQARIAITYAHELVHTFGLGHSLHGGLMMATAELYKYSGFQPLDVEYVRLLRTRQPGTQMVASLARENDRAAVTASAAGTGHRVEIIVCPAGR